MVDEAPVASVGPVPWDVVRLEFLAPAFASLSRLP